MSLRFQSILYGDDGPGEVGDCPAPQCFHDLFLDQVVDAVTRGREAYRLATFFHAPLGDLETIAFRHEVFQDLERPQVHDCATAFAATMQQMRTHLALSTKLHYTHQRERWYLDAIAAYSEAVTQLTRGLDAADVASRGFIGLLAYLSSYVQSTAFTSLAEQARQLRADLAALRYCLLIRGNRISVGRYDGELDYREEVLGTFERFQQRAVKDYRATFPALADMDHVEAGVLDLVADTYPELFRALATFCSGNGSYLDPTLDRFDRELQFYLAYLDYIRPLRDSGLELSYPHVSAQSKQVRACRTFDLALASKLTSESSPVVVNDFHLSDPERILVVSGPNQGGKTTLARTFGQLHYLAGLGCPVAGSDLRLPLTDQIYTHFDREEDFTTLVGKLEDDLGRVHTILDRATPASVIILNEIFISTTLDDALLLGREVLGRVSRLDALCVCVTFVDELSSLDHKTVSMVSTVVADNPAVRTYKLLRKPADGRAYALAIAAKHGLTYGSLKGRISG